MGRVARTPAPIGRTFRCSEEEHARIVELAKAAGTNVSRYMVACALLEDDGPAGQRLILTAKEQRALAEQAGRLDACVQALREPQAGGGFSILEGVRFLLRARRRRHARAAGVRA